MATREELQAKWEAETEAAPEPLCYAGWQEPIEVNVKGHRLALVTHRCKKKLPHQTDHECPCGRTWIKA